MSPLKSIVSRDRVVLFCDALLATTAAFCVVVGLTALLVAPTGEPRAGMEWATVVASVLWMVTMVVVPLLVWVTHGRRLSWLAVLGGAAGAASAGIVFMALAALSGALGLIASPFTDSEFAGPLLMLGIVAAAFVVAVAWLVVDAVRDLAGSRRQVGRDVVRIISAVVLVAFAAGEGEVVSLNPGDESGEALIFAMLAGFSGALAVAGAELLTSLRPKQDTGTAMTPLAQGGAPPGVPS